VRAVTSTEVLRRHATERHLRVGIRSANLDGDASSTPRMSESAWVTSCALTMGVPDPLLDILGVYYCETAGWSWREVLVEIQGEEHEVRAERVAIPLTLAQAAACLGLKLEYSELKKMRAAAIARVTDNMLARVERESGRAA
jgi:hypothetical protein